MFIEILMTMSLAQTCPTGCVDVNLLTEECIPEPPPICPLQALPGKSVAGAVLNDDGSWKGYNWLSDPFTIVSPWSSSAEFAYPMMGEGTSSGNDEWSCGILPDGKINCFGYSTVISAPTGGEPYGILSSGETGRFGVLDYQGKIAVWGNLANSFASNVPTTTGFVELGIGRDVGCAVGLSNAGASCFGYDARGLFSGRPTTGTYTSVDVGRDFGAAVKSDGTLTVWCSTSISATSTCSTFISNRPQPGVNLPTGVTVSEVELNGTSTTIGVAYLSDDSIYIWQDSSSGYSDALRYAPGWATYGVPTQRYYIPRGPDGVITWRTKAEISATDVANVCGVINDPAGLSYTNPAPGYFAFGDAVCWGNGNSPAEMSMPKFRCESQL